MSLLGGLFASLPEVRKESMSSPLGIWVVRREAEGLGRYLEAELGGHLGGLDCCGGQTNRETFISRYGFYRQWVLVMTTGIAVRYLEGLLENKTTDPAVVVIDEGCRFAISLVGGHEGGANLLAYRVANITEAVPVVTTATETLKPLIIGIGCRRGVGSETIDAAVNWALLKVSRKKGEIREVATIDLKSGERGLREWCDSTGVPLRIISRRLIQERPWVTSTSPWVREIVGVDGVCEPCALLSTYRGQLILPKTILDGVAVAIVEEAPWIWRREAS